MSEWINFESDYEYVIGSAMGNVLNIQSQFSTMEWAKSDLELIAKELVNTAKLFAVQQGLGAKIHADTSVNGNKVFIKKRGGNTGTLINSIHANVVGNGKIDFFNNANLGRGFYAGHIEYGFHDRAGNFVRARPFMRPALQAVARASMGQISGSLKAFMESGLLAGSGAYFGHPTNAVGNLRAFYNQSRGPIRGKGSGLYTVGGLKSGNKGNAQSRWSSVNSRNRLFGSIKGNTRDGFIGRENSRRFLEGNTKTSSTSKYAQYGRTKETKVKETPQSYSNYGKMNTNIPGRSHITQGSNSMSKVYSKSSNQDISGKGFNGPSTSEGASRYQSGRSKANTNIFGQTRGKKFY